MLNYDTTKLTYIGYQNLNSAISTGFLIINAIGNKIIISWANTTAANIGTGTIVQLRFNALASTTNINFDSQTQGSCEYSDLIGTILPSTYTNGTITINQAPTITSQPIDNTILVGQNTGFSLAASGSGLSYQWQISTNGGSIWADLTNNSIYSGVTTPSLGITNSLLIYSGYKYKCKITGTCTPIIYSNVVTLTVIYPITTTLPTNNFCPGSITVPVTVTNFTGIAAFSLVFSYNTSCLTYTGYQTLNAAISGGNFTINNVGGKIYMTWSSTTPVTFANGSIVELLFNSATGSSNLTWDITNNGSCEYSDINGTIITPVLINGSENIYTIPSVTSHPTNKTIAKGQSTSFSIGSSGTGLAYIWQVSSNGGTIWNDLTNNSTYSNVTTRTLSISNAQLAISTYKYRCKVTGTCLPIVFSNSATLIVLPNIITTCGTSTICPGQFSIPITVNDFIGVASFSLTLAYNPAVITFTGYQNLNNGVSAGFFNANAVNGKVYLTWSNISDSTISNGATLVELKFTGTPGSSSFTWDTQTLGSCEYTDINGQTIFSTWNNGNVTINTPPSISSHPVNRTTYATNSTTFSVTAGGTGLSYQWQVSTNSGSSWTNLTNVAPYSGVYTSTLSINPVTIAMNFNMYRCIVSGTCLPAITSNSAQLNVTQTPVTTTPGTLSNSCTGNISVPINVTNCFNVGGISLTMIYDTTVMIYDGYQAVNSALNSGYIVINRIGNKIYMSWASAGNLNIGSGTLIQYKFKTNTGINTSLSWDLQNLGACEYTDSIGNIITSIFNNSNISVVANTLIVNAGNDVNIAPAGSSQLNGSVTGGTLPYIYLWTPATALNNNSILNPVANPSSTTTYTLTITDKNNCSGSDQVTVNVVPLPGTAGAISGATSICTGNLVTYSVSPISNATSYIWTIPSGTNIVGANNTNSINVNIGTSAISGNITVKGHNSTGDGTISTLAVNINYLPDSAGTITGITSVNQGQNGVVYAVPPINYATSYIWTLPNGYNGISTSNSIPINFSNTSFSDSITVVGQNQCGFGKPSSLFINVSPSITIKQLTLHAMIQGFYQGNGIMSQTMEYDNNIEDFVPKFVNPTYVDTVSITIRSVDPPYYNILTDYYGIGLNTDGSMPILTLPSSLSNISYIYVVFKQRNSLETWSDSVNVTNSLVDYNFYTHPLSTQFIGNMSANYSNNIYTGSLIWSGETVNDWVINIFDLAAVFDFINDPNSPLGYFVEDVNGDGVVNIYDLSTVFDNLNLGVGSINPFTIKK